MRVWTDHILREFPADISRFWIALDPDGILLEETILLRLREREFEVLSFEDSISFRTEYEERYRSAWEVGKEGSAKALVLQWRGTCVSSLPWDYMRSARHVSLSLADIFPKLNYGVDYATSCLDFFNHEVVITATDLRSGTRCPLDDGDPLTNEVRSLGVGWLGCPVRVGYPDADRSASGTV